ncbi:MAG: flagellar filament capping protein FliD [Intrasporangium sp.]|uniref:flagellar filament capping protein FliD n=1 Tax=Intrasporangium sp. TaxID=1925024 RepID=UPI003F7F4707
MGVSLNGLGSGLDITSIVNALMAVEALPQQQLKSAQSTQQSMITALQSFNTKTVALKDLATKMAAPGALNLFTATTNSTAATATAGKAALPGTFSVSIDRLAESQTSVTAKMSNWPTDATGAPATLTLVDHNGKHTEITPASTSLDDLVTAINSSGGPAKALKVNAGTDPATGNQLFRLQLTATSSGQGGSFTIHQGTSAEVTAGTATDLMSQLGAAVVTTAQDAQATLYAGTAAEQVITSSTNTFSNLVPGVDVTATAEAVGKSVTVTIASDNAGVSKQASSLVSSVNDLLTAFANSTKVTTTTGTNGTSTAAGSIFTGNSTIRSVAQSITEAVFHPTSNGRSPSELGISIQRDGSYTFDEAKLSKALADDPAGTQATLQEIAGRVAAAAKNASDPIDGSITSLIKGRQSEVSDLARRIGDWDLRLADRQQSLLKLYNQMDTALGGLKAQQSWLTSQIASLPTFYTNSK